MKKVPTFALPIETGSHKKFFKYLKVRRLGLEIRSLVTCKTVWVFEAILKQHRWFKIFESLEATATFILIG